MIKRIALLIVALIAGVLIFATTKPDTFTVQRATTIKAPPEKVFAVLNDFKRWPDWSPWERLDPLMKRTISEPAAGKGATYAWEGNSDAGQGRMEIIESVPASKVGIQLDFIKPFESKNRTEFTLTPQGDTTQVNWKMTGPSLFVTKLMQVFVSMDSMIGKDFEAGLANLKALTEK